MTEFIAIVGWEDTKLAKYQGFDKEADADAHVVEYGGFVVADPIGAQSHWVIDEVAKTVTFDKAQFDIDKAHLAATAYQTDRDYGPISDQLDMQYWDAVNGTTTWVDHVAAVKQLHKKPD